MPNSSIPTGEYLIRNVRQGNLAFVEDNNERTPLTANYSTSSFYERWNVISLGNGYYNILNVGSNTYANTGNRAKVGDGVEGVHGKPQQFDISETRVSGQYTIMTTDTRLYWTMLDNQIKTPITLSDVPTDPRSWWIFERRR
ncbi:hypothetical protein AMATHDRAFT_67684 [Amanita thiersii Skay4041]|uniref:Ricin B lectin domain-containing protein n=1 Tax=Amanita thiersii Skay4041 TaxID=703135 RepID=A0A2A9NGV2_9AGAR|nr:hypothetical protein AMATHDRAFT_67684 [Amanita thiersii Skay4041]